MPYATVCRRCGKLYDERSDEASNVPAWAAQGLDRLCPDCAAFKRRDALIRADLKAGRLSDPDLFTAQVEFIERESATVRAELDALAHDDAFPAEYTVDAATEAAFNRANGRLAALELGSTVMFSAAIDACRHCFALRGREFTVIDASDPSRDPERHVWVGKNRYGHKGREHPAIPMHAYCRCSWLPLLTLSTDGVSPHIIAMTKAMKRRARAWDVTPAEAVDLAAEALDRAQHEATTEALDALFRALLNLAHIFEVTNPPDLPTVANWYALDAAMAVRYASHLLELDAAEHAILTARAALDVAPRGTE